MIIPPDDAPAPPPAAGATNSDDAAPTGGESAAPAAGVSLGTVTAGAAGAALGALGGLVGAVVGAVTGAFIAKEVTETAKPKDEEGSPPEPPRHEPLPTTMPLTAAPELQDVAAGALGEEGPDTAPAVLTVAEPVDLDVPPPAPPLSQVSGRLQRITFPAPPVVEVTAPTAYPEEDVRAAAYHRYLDRLRREAPGDEVRDWVEAEKEVFRG